MKKGLNIVLTVIILLVIGAIIYAAASKTEKASEYDAFAQCITDSGAKFYGAFWCPHCLEQKRMFGDSYKKLPYIECSTPDQKGQTQACIDAEVKSYPTWEFADGTRETGTLPFDKLAEKTNCSLPSSDAPSDESADSSTESTDQTEAAENDDVEVEVEVNTDIIS